MTSGVLNDIFAEKVVFSYFAYLVAERAPSTRAMALRQSVNFVGGLLGFDTAAVKTSARIRGLSVRLLRTGGVLKQRDPLTVKMVAHLERVATDITDPFLAVVAGNALMCLFGRARVGDAAKCAAEPVLDLAADGAAGFVQTTFMDHKTARPGVKRALPVVAPAFGVTGINWAAPWIQQRRIQGLDAATAKTLLQAPADTGGWTNVPMTTLEFGACLREILHRGGFSAAELGNIGAHSLKSTTLAWLARAGVDRDVRRVLGYHIRPDERAMEAYSRDSMAGPLRTLVATISAVATGRFRPDETRSGYFKESADEGPRSSTCFSRS